MTKRQLKENYARAVIFDEEGERKKACEARRKELYDGLEKKRFYLPRSESPFAMCKRFISGLINEMNGNAISKLSYVGWGEIDCILSFNMEYYYRGYTATGFDEEEQIPIYEPTGLSDFLPEQTERKAILDLFLKYLTAGAAFAKRIGAQTYPDWIQLMLKVSSFEGTPNVVKFPFDTLNEVVKRTWAENEVFKLNRMIAPHTPTHM